MKEKNKTVMFCAYAKLPRQLSLYEHFQICAEIDLKKGEVMDISCLPCTPILERILKDAMIGARLNEDIEKIVKEVEGRVFDRAKSAIVTAIKALHREYVTRQQENGNGETKRGVSA